MNPLDVSLETLETYAKIFEMRKDGGHEASAVAAAAIRFVIEYRKECEE